MPNQEFTPTAKQIEAFRKLRGPQKSTAKWIWLQQAISKNKSDACLLWPFALTTRGYGKCRYNAKDGMAHRLSFFFTYGRWPTPQTRHTCDVPACFNPRHIIEGTSLQNHQDMMDRHRQLTGERHPQAKLTETAVRQIRAAYGTKTLQEIADDHGVGHGTVKDIVLRVTWRNLP